jgi:A/G-specific adenine glycosylase
MTAKTRAPDAPDCLPSTDWNRSLARHLLPWFRRHQRDLPWRRSSDPYRIWISEIMLQQTQVVTVIPYFERFVASFPTVRELAAADENEVLRHWEGLGYYRRARQLHAAAKRIVTEHAGQFPQSHEAIWQLPGIGRYTAGAIASIAYDHRTPILEANTIRLLSRLFAQPGDSSTAAAQKVLWQLAEAIVPSKRCGQFNQALMELGSLICTPKSPRCGQCPVSELCAAFQQGKQDQIPGEKAKPQFEAVREAAIVVWHKDRIFLRRREPGERWAGLWDFVRFPLTAKPGVAMATEIQTKVRQQSGLSIGKLQKIATLKHGVTRFRITLDCYTAIASEAKPKVNAREWQWIAPENLNATPLSTTGRKLSKLVTSPSR